MLIRNWILKAVFRGMKTLQCSMQDFESVKAELTEEILELILEDIYKRAFVNW